MHERRSDETTTPAIFDKRVSSNCTSVFGTSVSFETVILRPAAEVARLEGNALVDRDLHCTQSTFIFN